MAALVNPEQERRALLASHLQRLVATPEWDMYAQEVSEMAQRTLKSLGSCSKEDFEQIQGQLKGILAVEALPQVLMAQGRRG